MAGDRDLLFGLVAVEQEQLSVWQFAQWKSGRTGSNDNSLINVVQENGWITDEQRAEVERGVEEQIREHGGDIEAAIAAMTEFESGVSSAPNSAGPEGEGDSAEFAQTFISDVIDPIDQPGKDNARPVKDKARAETVDFDRDSDSGDSAADDDEQSNPFMQTVTQSPGSSSPDADAEDSNPHARTFISNAPRTEGDPDADLPDDGHPIPLQTIDFKPENRSRYTLTRVYGEGGLGQVWLATDPSLRRQVALKRIRPGIDSDPQARMRLIREAQITGQLEHPNIIPVYELEHVSDPTKPYYTMKLLHGRELKDCIRDYHNHRAKGSVDPLELPQLLNLFVDICNAMAYAGSRNIIHRDLKPQNVMVGDFGEVLVLDWGLAKKIDDEVEEDLNGEQKRIEVQVTGDGSQTVMGQVVGSPAYMAPEQADGRTDKMDHRTDVYGLGAILFTILTGRAPHRGQKTGNTARDTMDLLKQISTGPPPEPRDADPSVTPALNAICKHAMARERDDRYQDASELAADIQRWLADEPVSVYEEPWRQRAGRWLRKNRAWAQSIAASLLVVTGIAVVATFVVDGARRRETEAHAETHRALTAEEEAKAAAEAARAEAARRFRQARRAVDESLTGVSMALDYYPGVQELRTRLLQRAAEDYEQFAQEKSDDPELRLEFALALVRLGYVRRLLVQVDESQAAYDAAIEIFSTYLKDDADNPELNLELARTHTSRAELMMVADRHEQAEADLTAAAGILAVLRAGDPGLAEYERSWAEVLANRGILYTHLTRNDEAIETLGLAEQAFADLVESTAESDDAEKLAKTRIALGELYGQVGRQEDAEKILERAITTFEALVREDPDHPPWLQGLADVRIAMANVYHVMGRPDDQIRLYEGATSDYQALVRTRPDVPLYRSNLATNEANLAQALMRQGRADEARTHAETSLGVSMDLSKEHGLVYDYKLREAFARVILGLVLTDVGDLTLAETAFTLTIEQINGNENPDWNALRLRAQSYQHLGVVHSLNGSHDLARQVFMQAITEFTSALEQLPDDGPSLDGLAWCQTWLGDALVALERSKESKTFYRMALETRANLLETPEHQYAMAWLLVNCLDEEFRDADRARELTRKLAALSTGSGKYQTLNAAVLYRQEKWDESLEALSDAEARSTSRKNGVEFWRAMVLFRKGLADSARHELVNAVERMDRFAPGDELLMQLRREAEALIGEGETPAPDDESR